MTIPASLARIWTPSSPRRASRHPSWPASLRLGIGGVALASVLAGHAVTYAVVTLGSPAELLAVSGHGYLDAAVRIGFAGFLITVLLAFAGRLRSALDGPCRCGVGAADLFPALARLQIGVFSVQEIGERWVAGAPVSGVLQHGLLAIGLVSQLGLATLGARFLRWVLRAADRIGRALRTSCPRSRRGPRHRHPAGRHAGPPAGTLTSWSLRGPPDRARPRMPVR